LNFSTDLAARARFGAIYSGQAGTLFYPFPGTFAVTGLGMLPDGQTVSCATTQSVW
jgi:hypothetical protein